MPINIIQVFNSYLLALSIVKSSLSIIYGSLTFHDIKNFIHTSQYVNFVRYFIAKLIIPFYQA